MFRGVLYFAGPMSRWSGKIADAEIIAPAIEAPWLWLVRWQIRSIHRQLNQYRVGYAILNGDECVEQYDPPLPDPIASGA